MTGYVLTVGVPAATTNTTALLLLALALTITPATHRAMGRGRDASPNATRQPGPTRTTALMRESGMNAVFRFPRRMDNPA